MNDELVRAISDLEEDEAIELVHAMLDSGSDPQVILDASREAMAIVGARYEQKEYFLPELIIAGELLTAIAELVKPKLATTTAGKTKGTVVVGTVAGDIHDIGKNVVCFMLDVNNFEVVDLGVDVPAEVFVEKIEETGSTIIGLSGFLTLAFDEMKHTVEAISAAGLRETVKIMIGGAIMDDTVVRYVGADAYGADATAAVRLAEGWVAS